MKAFVFEEPGKMVWKNVDRPVLVQPYGVVLSPVAVSVCSSDIHTVFGGGIPKQKNHILGHECIARVEEVGSGVRDFKIGDIVAVPSITPDWRNYEIQNGNDRHAGEHFSGHQLGRTAPGVFAERFALPDADTTLAHIPENVSLEQALMCVDVMTTGFTGVEYADIGFGDTVVVMGIGPIGLMAVAGAHLSGAANIIAVGSRKICVDLAIHYGASEVLNYKNCNITETVLERTNNVGCDSVIIAGGNDDVFTQAVDMVRYGTGVISNINYYGGTGFLKFPKFSGGRGMAGKTIHTELAKGGRLRLEHMLKMVSYSRVDPSLLITHKFSGLSGIEKAMNLMKTQKDDVIKTMITI